MYGNHTARTEYGVQTSSIRSSTRAWPLANHQVQYNSEHEYTALRPQSCSFCCLDELEVISNDSSDDDLLKASHLVHDTVSTMDQTTSLLYCSEFH